MAMFLAEIVFIFELALFSAGLLTLHYAVKEKSNLVRAAGYIMVVGSILTIICTAYFSSKYYFQGDFDTVSPHMEVGQMEENNKVHVYYREGLEVDKKQNDMLHEIPRD